MFGTTLVVVGVGLTVSGVIKLACPSPITGRTGRRPRRFILWPRRVRAFLEIGELVEDAAYRRVTSSPSPLDRDLTSTASRSTDLLGTGEYLASMNPRANNPNADSVKRGRDE
jgi:hypothetical protein